MNFSKLLAGALLVLSMTVSAQAAGTRVPVLTYHNLTTDPKAVNSMTITAGRFRQDMEYLKENGYTTLLARDLIAIKAGGEGDAAKPVMVTFDDGYVSNYYYAFPVLQELHQTATISIITSHVPDGSGNGVPTTITWKQARTMVASGVIDIGTHTDHQHGEENNGRPYPLDQASGVERRPEESWAQYQARVGADLLRSVYLIEQNVGNEVLFAAYPFGREDAWYRYAMQVAGVPVSVTTDPGVADLADGLYDLPRYTVTMKRSAQQILSGIR